MSSESFDLSLFETVSFSKETVAALVAVCVLLVVVTVGFYIYWRIRHKAETSFKWTVFGALGFLVSARVFELGLHYFCILSDNAVARFITGNHAAYVLYGVLTAGLFEECGRYLIIKHLLKKDRTRENAVAYGIGHGGSEVLLVMLPVYVSYLAVAFAFTRNSVPDALAQLNITAENASAAFPTIAAVSKIATGDLIAPVLERILTMFVHIGLSVIVYRSVNSRQPKFLLFAVLLHMAVDVFPALYQRGLVSLWLTEGWLALWTLVILLFARKLYAAEALSDSAK